MISKCQMVFSILLIGAMMSVAQNDSLGVFRSNTDIGNVVHPGQVKYDTLDQSYTVSGSGTNMWFGKDELHYVYKKMTGDFILRARVSFVGKGVDPHRKLGWLVRNALDTASPHVNATVHGDGLTSLQFRRTAGGDTEEVRADTTAPDVIQLERRGSQFIMSIAAFGEPFQQTTVSDLSLNDSVYVGIYVCAHNPDVVEQAVYKNVRIVVPPPAEFEPYQDYLGSHVEVMDVESGIRNILHTAPNSLQAPNWRPDNSSLIYNSDGLLFDLDLKTRIPTKIPTGFATSNNNDHVLSFDGKQLGISHHSQEHDGQSIIYTMPSDGGWPQLITPTGPSYLHGWSPDNQFLIYTGGRNNQYDIYQIPIEGKEEIQLTNTKGLDDGSEYTPDGAYIYFNSNRTGTMQIWRMKPDGSQQEQITTDKYNDWFPHISPDGKWIAFLSYMPEVPSGDHPFYKHVYLRLMPITGGEPKVIAYVFGGQGTINVPSWSPDSKKIAFVSNTLIK